MKVSTLLTGALASLTAAQSPAPYTDAKSGITFSTFQHSSGLFFGLALPTNNTGNTDFIATVGGKGTGWSGSVLSSFRKAAQYGSPAVTTGTFSQSPIANGTYVNSTHWTYTFLCQKCIQSDGTTFKTTDQTANIGYAVNANAPSQKTNVASTVTKHSDAGQVEFDLSQAKSDKFDTWKAYAAPKTAHSFQA
ncbi:hypothetical protein N0V83_004625 [Neocucurbitaria cava]|uniref:Cellobiose dehydrogenase-like cytochrome domain-containing protein n=1 Tax=Neocucurbitaria cava TaxID=798079 RepID=A0A9W8YBW3_9PLEO|nr:hypothetical protein N0V83_004625 [Neocucurbitaria cava]